MLKVQESGRFRGNFNEQQREAYIEDELAPKLWQSLGINMKIMPFMDGNYLTHKIVIQDIEERDNKVWKKRTPVNFAYLRLGDESLAGEEDSVLDLEDGFKNFAYLEDSNPEKTLMRYLVIPDSLSVWFNRTPKSTDLSFELSFVEHQEAWLSLAACFKEMSGIQN